MTCCSSVHDLLLELVDVVGGAEPGLAPGLFAEQLGQAVLELVGAGGHADAALLGGEQVGLQGGPADRGSGAWGGWAVGLSAAWICSSRSRWR